MDLLERATELSASDLKGFVDELESRWQAESSQELILPWGFALWRLEAFEASRRVLDLLPPQRREDSMYLVVRGMVLRRLPACDSAETQHALRLSGVPVRRPLCSTTTGCEVSISAALVGLSKPASTSSVQAYANESKSTCQWLP